MFFITQSSPLQVLRRDRLQLLRGDDLQRGVHGPVAAPGRRHLGRDAAGGQPGVGRAERLRGPAAAAGQLGPRHDPRPRRLRHLLPLPRP